MCLLHTQPRRVKCETTRQEEGRPRPSSCLVVSHFTRLDFSTYALSFTCILRTFLPQPLWCVSHNVTGRRESGKIMPEAPTDASRFWCSDYWRQGHGTQGQVGCMALDFLYHKTNKDPRYNPYNRMWVSKELWTSTWLAQMSVYQPGVVVDPLTLPSSRMCPPPLATKPGGRTRLSRYEPGHNAKARRDTQHLLTDPLYIDMLGGNMKTSIKKCTKCGGAGWVCLPACCFLLCVLPCMPRLRTSRCRPSGGNISLSLPHFTLPPMCANQIPTVFPRPIPWRSRVA